MRTFKILQLIATLFTVLFFSAAVSTQLAINPLWMAGGLVLMALSTHLAMYLLKGKPVRGLFMAVTAYGCATDILLASPAVYTVAPDCVDEGTGILGMGLIKKGFNIVTGITDQTEYDAAVTAKDIYAVKDMEAYWPAGTPVTIPGKAGRMERLGYINYEMPFKVDGVDANLHFWNSLNQNRNYGVFFVTEEYKAFSPLDRDLEPILAAFFAQPTGEQEFGKQREIAGTVKWKGKDLVQYLDNLTPAVLKAAFQP